MKGKGRCVVAKSIINDAKPVILLNGHLDTVEVCKGWTKEPFKPTVEGDRLFGLGSVDMKGGVAIAIMVFKEAVEMGLNVIFVGTIDEEGDSAGGFAVKEELEKLAVKPDICLITEPTNDKIMMGCCGRYIIDVKVNGLSAHGAVPQKGVNAIVEAGRFVSQLDKLPLLDHEILGAGSVCPLDISGGTSTLSVPEECRIKIDRHVVPGETPESVMGDMRKLADSIGSQATFGIMPNKERPTPFLEPYITTRSDMLAQKFVDVVGGEITYGKSVGDYNVFSTIAPTIVHGPVGDNWHSADEWVSISSIERCLENYRKFFLSF